MRQNLVLFLSMMLLFAVPSNAQELPQPSQKAMVMQRIGLTDITMTYHRPLVNERKIWGELVPYGEMWRTGANAAPTIEFSTDVMIAGHDIAAGKYALFTIPGEDEWTVVINKHWDQGGTSEYDQKDDVARFTVEPEKLDDSWEAMTFLFTHPKGDKVDLHLIWDKLRIAIPISVNVKDMAMANMLSAIKEQESAAKNWRMYARSASYLANNGGDLNQAQIWIDQSLQMERHWYNLWIKAQILEKLGNRKEALATAKQAKALGDKDQNFFFKGQVENAIEEWSAGK